MKAWITKYALTAGIYEIEAELSSVDPSGNMIREIPAPGVAKYGMCFFNKDWHPDKESAVIRAEEMRQKRIKSLQKSIAKLEKKVF